MRRATRTLGVGLALVLAGCEPAPRAGPAAESPEASRLGAVLGAPGAGFARADRVQPFAFPADHGAHPDFRHEWWYVTGNLDAADGARFGFQLTFFRFALAPALPERPGTSAWRTRQIYMAHFAVTDVARAHFAAHERFARGALELAGARSAPLRVWLEDWSLEALPGAPERWRLRAAHAGYALDLELDARATPVPNGEAGLSRKSATSDAASYYYSLPRLPARGQLRRDGEALAVRGLAWLDREWGSGALDPSQEGWDWFALQLDDGSALMLYALRRRDGSADPASGGTWVAPDGTARALTAGDYSIEVLAHWQSPRGGRYPARWRIRAAAPALDVELEPVLADQELGGAPRYWEGAVDLRGTRAGARIAGRGYAELVGYAR